MSRSLGVLLVVVAVLTGAVGGFWGFMKAAGGEADICTGAECTSGWYGAGALLVFAVISGGLGVRLLRGGGQPPRVP